MMSPLKKVRHTAQSLTKHTPFAKLLSSKQADKDVCDHAQHIRHQPERHIDKINSENQNDGRQATKSIRTSKVNNAFTKMLMATQFLPKSAQSIALTQVFGRIVPYVGTTGIKYETVTPNKVIVSLDNKKSVQNHIGSVHAVAVTLLAETATGFILGVNLPSDRVLLVKSYAVNFYRPLKKGQVAAVATLTDEQRAYILDTPKGDMIIPCVIEDRESNSDRAPITVEMTWAWIPKSELNARREGKKS